MNHYPLWKNSMVLAIILIGSFLALPNLFGDAPALQVGNVRGEALVEGTAERLRQVLQNAGIEPSSVYREEGRVYLLFDQVDDQFTAREVVLKELESDGDLLAAMTLAPRTPAWLRALGVKPMSLGLDLRGGVHFLYQVDMKQAISQYLERNVTDFKALLRDADARHRSVELDGDQIRIVLRDETRLEAAQEAIRGESSEYIFQVSTDSQGRANLLVSLSETQIRQRQDFAVEQNITTIRNRVNALGVAEPLVQRQGADRILVQLPGVQDPTRVKTILGATATLEFRGEFEGGDPFAASSGGRAPLGSELYYDRNNTPALLKRDVIASGDQLTDATSGFSQEGQPAVFVKLDPKGAKSMLRYTQDHIDRRMAVLYIDSVRKVIERNGEPVEEVEITKEIISLATIRGVFSSNFQITGLSQPESVDLALLLRSGSLAAPLYIVEERTVGPTLGQDNIDRGFMSVVIGFALVVVFMLFYYRVFGVFANLALLTNLVLIIGLLSLLQASLTLPGIAGIVLTVGMAVDANVLIFERIREETRNGLSPQAAIHSGYDKAFSSIADANITTLIAAVVLWLFGTGPIKGFAITLSLGIITSMFTAIIGTRALVNLVYGHRNVKQLSI